MPTSVFINDHLIHAILTNTVKKKKKKTLKISGAVEPWSSEPKGSGVLPLILPCVSSGGS